MWHIAPLRHVDYCDVFSNDYIGKKKKKKIRKPRSKYNIFIRERDRLMIDQKQYIMRAINLLVRV